MNTVKLQAHKGVASDCPENTIASFECAALQGYDVIELDLDYTRDCKIIVLHDSTINRTARNSDGSKIETEIKIHDITLEQARKFDFGLGFSNKFIGERIPLFKDVLDLARKNKIKLKIDNKITAFPEEILNILFDEIRGYEDYVSITSNKLDFVEKCLKINNKISIDYDGEITEEVLIKLTSLLPYEKLTVWLPYECSATSWVTIPFANKERAELVKRYARLGLWIISDCADFEAAVSELSPYIVETDGTVKPETNSSCRFDMHTHSKSSHDSQAEVEDVAKSAKICGFAVTDHCDIEFCNELDLNKIADSSISDAMKADEKSEKTVLHGIEMGEAFWHREVEAEILQKHCFDVVIGSVHAVKFEGFEMPYSTIDFGKEGVEFSRKYLNKYFDDVYKMLNECNFDVLAHLTCPLRYINGKYLLNISCMDYKDKILKILAYIIEHKIALEINTSCVFEGSKYCEYMPEQWIIELYRAMGGYLITTGSDAHIAENAANSFDSLYSLLRELGFKNIFYFKNRLPIQCSLL